MASSEGMMHEVAGRFAAGVDKVMRSVHLMAHGGVSSKKEMAVAGAFLAKMKSVSKGCGNKNVLAAWAAKECALKVRRRGMCEVSCGTKGWCLEICRKGIECAGS